MLTGDVPYKLRMFPLKSTKKASTSQPAQAQINKLRDSSSTYCYDPKKDVETSTRPTNAEIKAIKKGNRPHSLDSAIKCLGTDQ